MLMKLWRHIQSPKYFPAILTVILLGISSLFMTFLTSDQSMTVAQESLTVHQEPSTRSKIITKIDKHRRIHILDEKHQWLLIRVNNHAQGWVPKWLVENPQLNDESNLYAYIQKELPLFEKDSKNYPLKVKVKSDSYLPIQEVTKEWLKVAYENKTGYLPLESVKILSLKQLPKDMQEEKNDRVGEIELKKKTDNTVYVRANQAYFMDAPSYFANTIYDLTYNQDFEYISSATDENGEEFYLVEDEEGIRGYINARIVAFAKDYTGHYEQTDATSLKDATILIDPGHGGEDNGASSLDGTYFEKNYTLPTGLKIKKALEAKGAKVFITRDKDTWVDLEARVNQSHKLKVDAFISVHYDASSDVSWNGSTVYYFHESDYNLANYLNKALVDLPIDNNGTLFGNFQVIRDNHYPAVLLELGYITNPNDLEYILQEKYYDQIANQVVKGLETYFAEKR